MWKKLGLAIAVCAAAVTLAAVIWRPPEGWERGMAALRWLPDPVAGAIEWITDATRAFVFVSPYQRQANCGTPEALAALPATLRFRAEVDPDSEIVVAAVGDLLIHTSLQAQAVTHPRGFWSLWHGTTDLMRAADITYANLEGAVARDVTVNGRVLDEPAAMSDRRVYTGFPQFNYPPTLPLALAEIGIDVVSTANNHALDRFAVGVDRTLDALDEVGIRATGTRRRNDSDATWHTVVQARGKRVAFLACTFSTNGIPDLKNQVLYCYRDRATVLENIRKLRATPDIDAIILTPHWGRQYTHVPDAAQRALARDAVEAGADAVIGTHPHVVQPWQIHRTKSGHEGFIAYSTGNFIGGYRSLQRRTTPIVLLGLAETPDGRLVAAGARYIPLRTTFNGPLETGRITVQVVDRAGYTAAANRAHIMSLIPAGLIHPPTTPLSTLTACPGPEGVVG